VPGDGLRPRPIAASLDELLAGASARGAMDKHRDSLSGSGFERAVVGGVDCVVKHLGYEVDWLARALGDVDCFALTVWRAGLLDALPRNIDHTVLGMARDAATGTVSILMRDVGRHLVPPGTDPLRPDDHLGFLADMARMHARLWGFTDTFGLLDQAARYRALAPDTGRREAAAGHADPVPRALPGGWAALRAAAPAVHDDALALATDAGPLVRAMAETPSTFVHGDWKAGNLGRHPDGRTILLDWGWPGQAGPLVDIGWYLAVNCDRLPASKEQTVAAYRRALERQGVSTAGWWDRQLELALLGAFLQLGWSKTGDSVELGWWLDRVGPIARDLAR
jgi:hypothetical protein